MKDLAYTKDQIKLNDPSLKPAFDKLLKNADKALENGPYSVIFKNRVPPSGDKHDYISQGPYYWQDTTKPNGLPYINRDGEVNPESKTDFDSPVQGKMASEVETLALAYYFTGKKEYGDHAALLLRTWYLDSITRMNPNLEFGQQRPGKKGGNSGGIIETTSIIKVTDAIGLLKGLPSWTAADQKGLEEWFSKYLHWLLTSPIGIKEGKATNNHSTWYYAQVVHFALFTHNTTVAKEYLEKTKTLIARQIESDGSMPLELKRTKSFGYTLFNLNAFLNLAESGTKVGVDLYHFTTPDGRSIRKAIDFIAPYINPEKPWPYQEIKGVSRNSIIPILRHANKIYPDAHYQELISPYLSSTRDKASRNNLLVNE
jgi:hypothetical protein